MSKIERRTLLAMGGSAALGAVIGGVSVGAVMRHDELPVNSTPSPAPRLTFAQWRRTRKAPYYIAHRGAADVAPEHTLPSYQTALDWGAEAIEISVVMSADRDLFCLHDLTLNRTTTLTGIAARQSSSLMDTGRVAVPRLGPRWMADMPPLPRLKDVLAALGGRAVLCIEAKDDSAYPLMIEAIEAAGLRDSVMIKVVASSGRLAMAKEAEYPVFAYVGNPQVATATVIDRLGKVLDPESDALVLPSMDGDSFFSATLIRRAVATGVPVWVFPVHRRYEVGHFTQLGVEGIVSPDIGYLTGAVPIRKTDNWASGAIAPGDLTKDPFSNTYGLQWKEEGVIGLDFPERASFMTLGGLGPIRAESYRLAFDASFEPLPRDTYQHLSVAFGHSDDRYYEHRIGNANGFHAILRADGGMGIYAHVEGDTHGKLLAPSRASAPLQAGVWAHLTLDVTPDLIRWSRDDGTSIEVKDPRFRGGYFHLGRSAKDGMLKLRNVTVT